VAFATGNVIAKRKSNMSNQNFRAIGSDPEVFVTDPTGKVVPIIGLVGGTKDNPLALGDGYAVQEDGVALEYNIPVCTSSGDFIRAIEKGLKLSAAKLPAGYGTLIKPDHEFTADQLSDPLSWVSGCDPDFSAWTMEERTGLNYEAAKKPLARYCGGHVHISYPNAKDRHPMTKMYLVRLADMLLGVPARWLEGNSIRSQEFGVFGIYRPKTYGLEYRTMSNVWLNIPILMQWVADCSFYVAGLAERAEQYCTHIYAKDGNEVPDELLRYSDISDVNIRHWEKTAKDLGLYVPAELLSLLYQKSKESGNVNKAEYFIEQKVPRARLGIEEEAEWRVLGGRVLNVQPGAINNLNMAEIQARFVADLENEE
jgi:hypothetical protein